MFRPLLGYFIFMCIHEKNLLLEDLESPSDTDQDESF